MKNEKNASAESLLQLALIVAGGLVAGFIVFWIFFAAMHELWGPLMFWLFGQESIVSNHYEFSQSGFATFLSWAPFVVIIGAGVFLTLGATSDSGLVALIIGGLLCLGAGLGTYIAFAEFEDRRTPKSWDYERGVQKALEAGDYQTAFAMAGTNERLERYEILRDALERGATRGENQQAVRTAIQRNMINIRCIYYLDIWANPTAAGMDFVESLGARIYSNGTDFRRNCPDRRFRESDYLQGAFETYIRRNWKTQNGSVLRAFWRRGYFLDAAGVERSLSYTRERLSSAVRRRAADEEEMLTWALTVLEYIEPSPRSRQLRLLEQWGG